jgi:hypothetical protein
LVITLDTFYDGRAKSSLLIGTYPFPIVFSPALKRKAFGWLASGAGILSWISFVLFLFIDSFGEEECVDAFSYRIILFDQGDGVASCTYPQ